MRLPAKKYNTVDTKLAFERGWSLSEGQRSLEEKWFTKRLNLSLLTVKLCLQSQDFKATINVTIAGVDCTVLQPV